MSHLTTGYFLSQRLLERLDHADMADPDVVARQKALLSRITLSLRRR